MSVPAAEIPLSAILEPGSVDMTASRKPPDRSTLIGSKIRQLRKARNLTQAYLADRVGIQQSDLCRMENGEYRVSLDVLFRILMEFKISMSEFFQEPPVHVPEEQRVLLEQFDRLTPEGREEIREFMRFKISQEKSGKP
jgi:transcriptional regulator with XRE-family HTH domain